MRKRTYTTCKNIGRQPKPIRWRQGLAHWLMRKEMMSHRVGLWLQKGIARADFSTWRNSL
ncbi:MAG: hypothetical protein VST64_08325 [Nitrospirota bacterium]|nr:hypothetical protein [Nitrospirota bacterium]